MVFRTERGWAGHFICAQSCAFRRNTLLSYDGVKIVISTVGNMYCNGNIETVGHERYYETMAFHADAADTRFYDANVSEQVYFDSEWTISELDADDRANEMHEKVVEEIATKLLTGNKFAVKKEWD